MPADGTHNIGVSWSGIDGWRSTRPVAGQDPAYQAERARKVAEFAKTARGRFVEALREAEGYPTFTANVERARQAYSRGFSDPDRPPSLGELGVALLALVDVPGKAARAALEALAEIEIEAHARWAA